ncbi:MAG: rod-binding protein [bacterium]
MQLPSVTSTTPANSGPQDLRSAVLMERSKALEATFLAEMLSYAGMGKSDGPFTGGIGEQQFESFLREAQARAIVAHGGIGLAERLFKSLARHDNASR